MAKEPFKPTELPPIFIKQLMKARGIKSKDIAETIGTTEATISRKLNGKRGLELVWLQAFAKALGLHVSDLFVPPRNPDPDISGDDQILAALHRIKGLNDRGIELAFTVITNHLSANPPPTPSSSGAGDQSDTSTPHHGSAASRAKS